MRVIAIINPVSGAGADYRVAEGRRALVAAALDRRQLSGTIHFTERAGHAGELARAAVADRADSWSCGAATAPSTKWGGADRFDTALGLVPAGSGNGLAAGIACSRIRVRPRPRARRRAASIRRGPHRGRPFFNIAGIGVDARIAAEFNLRPAGRAGLVALRSHRYPRRMALRVPRLHVELDGESRPLRALPIAFANGRQYGNGITLCARAELDDGLLDATVVEDHPVWRGSGTLVISPEAPPNARRGSPCVKCAAPCPLPRDDSVPRRRRTRHGGRRHRGRHSPPCPAGQVVRS